MVIASLVPTHPPRVDEVARYEYASPPKTSMAVDGHLTLTNGKVDDLYHIEYALQ